MHRSNTRLSLAAAFLVLAALPAASAQNAPAKRGLHDSITVTTLSFPGAEQVSPDELRRGLTTRGSPCRLPFLIPICKITVKQLFTDRRRTTAAALGDDITKIRVIYWLRGFRNAQVDTVLTPKGDGESAAIAFRIVEGEPVRISTLSITQKKSVLSDDELAKIVELSEGGPLNLMAMDSTIAHLRTAIWNKGFGDVRIDTSVPRPDASNRVPVRIDIDPRWLTRVGSVSFEGNTYTDSATLRRGVMLQPGTLYTRDAVLESEKRLFQLPALARALVITPAVGDSIKAITIAVAEVPKRHVAATVGFNTIEYGQAAIDLRHNDLGAGRWLSVRGAVGNLFAQQLDNSRENTLDQAGSVDAVEYLRPTYQATLTLTQPWIAGARTSAAFSAFGGRRAIKNIVIDEDIGASIGIVRDLAPRIPFGVNYRLEATRVQGSAVYYCAGYGICDAASRDALTRWQRLAPVGVSGWIDTSDDLEVPTTGYTVVVDAEHASAMTGSTFGHTRVSADASLYRSIGERKVVAGSLQFPKVLAFHVRAGAVTPLGSDRSALGVTGDGPGILHPRARFYAGGMQSVRGFAENELGPTVLQARKASLLGAGCTDATIANGSCDPTSVPNNELFARPIGGSSVIEGSVEARIPLAKALGGVLFLDGAYVGVSGLGSIAKGKGAITPGVGFRYRSPLGVLRMDFGLRPVGAELLPVVVSVLDAQGNDGIVRLSREKSFSTVDPSPGALRSIARRIVVHFAMGQAF